MFHQKHKVELWQTRRKFFNKKMKSCCSGYELVSKIERISKRNCLLQIGHVEANFDRSNEFFKAEGPKLFTQYPKMMKKLTIFFKKRRFFLDSFWWKHRMKLRKPLKKLFDKRLKKLARSPNMIKRRKFFLKNLFPQNGPMDRQKAVFTALSSFFGEKPKNLLIFRNC